MKDFSINTTEYEAFLKTLPDHVRHERFEAFDCQYDVAKALFIINKVALKTINIDVVAWAEAMNMADEVMWDEPNFFCGIVDTEVFVSHINTNIPIVIVQHSWFEKKKRVLGALIIDGHKRLRRAFLDKRKGMPAHYLKISLAKHARIK